MVQILMGRSSGKAGAGRLALLTLDACLSQDPHYINQVTRYPIEQGMDITDHILIEPDTLKIEGIVSNTPDSELNTISGNRVVNAYEMLLNIAGREMLHKTSETLDEFPGPFMVDVLLDNSLVMADMICEDFNAPRDPATGDAIQFSMTFTKVRMATVDLAAVTYTSAAIGGAGTADTVAPESNQGKQQTTASPIPLATSPAPIVTFIKNMIDVDRGDIYVP